MDKFINIVTMKDLDESVRRDHELTEGNVTKVVESVVEMRKFNVQIGGESEVNVNIIENFNTIIPK